MTAEKKIWIYKKELDNGVYEKFHDKYQVPFFEFMKAMTRVIIKMSPMIKFYSLNN